MNFSIIRSLYIICHIFQLSIYAIFLNKKEMKIVEKAKI